MIHHDTERMGNLAPGLSPGTAPDVGATWREPVHLEDLSLLSLFF